MTLDHHLYALVMAGGQGTRFWPESTSKMPKQYLKLIGKNSLLAETLLRFDPLIASSKRFIVTIKKQEDLVCQEVKSISGHDHIILEPSGRNTAPCLLLSLAHLLSVGASLEDVIVVVPSDHVILNKNSFLDVIFEAYQLALSEKKILTIGIRPTFPHTGFGYIHRGSSYKEGVYQVDSFKEKPDLLMAKDYLASGEYYWNAGMFVGSIGVFLEEFEHHAPEQYVHFQGLQKSLHSPDMLKDFYDAIPKNSIDYAVMEKSKRVMIIEARFDWNDLGSWDALESVISPMDDNTWVSARDHYVDEAHGNIIFAPDKFVTLIGVEDLVVVVNDKNVMILPKKDSQKVKEVVTALGNHPLKEELI